MRRANGAGGRLDGRVVILTGAGGAIGSVYARRLAREGARLALLDVDGPRLRAVAGDCRELGADVVELVADVSDAGAVREAVAETASRLGGVDALVNNAALFSTLQLRPFEEIPAEEVDRILAINVRGPFLLCQAVVPHMRRRGGGKIVNIASGTVLSASTGFAHYVTSKGAVFALTRALARELGADHITVNTLAPGLTITEAVRAQYSEERLAASRRLRCLERDEVPADLEGTLVYLLSTDSDFVTGQMIVVNGGAQFW
jgi:NAD(P)-dependent dehydrogenase (short-subunit alcohol dehydrogenase family)